MSDNGKKPLERLRTERGVLFQGDAIQFLSSLERGSVDLIVADPPYNLKKAEWDTFSSQTSYIDWSMGWIRQAAQCLKPTGTLYICGFSEILAELKVAASDLFDGCRWLVWHYRNKANLGRDWGRSHESILHFRMSSEFIFNQDDIRVPYNRHTLKYPEHPQAESSQFGGGQPRSGRWTPHPRGAKPRDVLEIPTLCNGSREKVEHPTQKPLELILRLVSASSNPESLLVDPFAGSGTTAVVAEFLGRNWFASELNSEYIAVAAERIRSGADTTQLAELIELPGKTEERREKLRGKPG